MGLLTHAVASTQLTTDRAFTPAALRETLDVLLPSRVSVNHRQAIRQRIVTALMVYRNELVPTDWRFVSAEQIARDIKLDLVWETGEGNYIADELKTGSWPTARLPAMRRQCAAQCLAGRDIFGDRFEMVRLVIPAARRIGEMRLAAFGEFRWL